MFRPERFLTAQGKLDPEVPDPIEVFGFGRRMCPGRYFASDVVWLTMANILATFAIINPPDKNGNVIEPTMEYTSGVFRSLRISSRFSLPLTPDVARQYRSVPQSSPVPDRFHPIKEGISLGIFAYRNFDVDCSLSVYQFCKSQCIFARLSLQNCPGATDRIFQKTSEYPIR